MYYMQFESSNDYWIDQIGTMHMYMYREESIGL